MNNKLETKAKFFKETDNYFVFDDRDSLSLFGKLYVKKTFFSVVPEFISVIVNPA